MKTRAKWVGLVALFLIGCAESEQSGDVIPVAPGQDDAMREADENPLPSFDAIAKDSRLIGGATDNTVTGQREFGGELRMTIPDNWEEVERTPIQRTVLLALFRIPGTTIEISVSSAGGGIDSNFERWRGQFLNGDQKETAIDFSDSVARLLSLTGGFRPGFGREDKESWMMLGAALPKQPNDYYIKLTGQQDEVLEVKDRFEEVIGSASFF